MTDHLAERPPSHAALLELREERELVREGYDFLDEKRLLLAAELLRQIAHYQALHQRLLELQDDANARLAGALERHGLHGLQVHPVPDLSEAVLDNQARAFLGVRLQRAALTLPGADPPTPVDPSPESRRCAAAFRELMLTAGELGAVAGNLRRLLAEYRRTQRRARALEDVLLPEIEQALEEMTVRLEELEQEETVRVRVVGGRGNSEF